eukprot:IDg21193t1
MARARARNSAAVRLPATRLRRMHACSADDDLRSQACTQHTTARRGVTRRGSCTVYRRARADRRYFRA